MYKQASKDEKQTMTQQQKRLLLAGPLGALTGFLTVVLTIGLVGGPIEADIKDAPPLSSIWKVMGDVSPLAAMAGLSAAISMHFIWRRVMLRRETRMRGFSYGVITGLIALILMMFSVFWGSEILRIFQGREADLSVGKLLIEPLAGSLFAFIMGGFMALPVAGALGFMLSRDAGTD